VWFSPEEYKQLYTTTRQPVKEPEKKDFDWEAAQLHDRVLFAVNTGIRPDEAWRLEFRDSRFVDDEDLGKTILEIEVRGKRGIGYCKSIPGAVRPFKRLRSGLRPARIDGVNTPTKPNTRLPASNTVWHTTVMRLSTT
jgi:integrase